MWHEQAGGSSTDDIFKRKLTVSWFHLSMGFNWQEVLVGSCNGLAPIRWLTITLINDNPTHCRLYTSISFHLRFTNTINHQHRGGTKPVPICMTPNTTKMRGTLKQTDCHTECFIINDGAGFILCIRPAMRDASPIGWAHSKNDPRVGVEDPTRDPTQDLHW